LGINHEVRFAPYTKITKETHGSLSASCAPGGFVVSNSSDSV